MQPALRIASDSDQAKKLPKRINFTLPVLKAMKSPATGRTWIYDARTPGLAFMATANGARAFYVYRSYNGRPLKYQLGNWPDLSLDDARDMAAKVNYQIANGIDPRAERQEQRRAETFKLAFDTYLEQHAKLKKRTWREDQQKYELHLKQWANRKLDSISQGEVQALHARIGKTHPGAANRTLSLLSKVFNHHRISPNPAAGITRFAEVKRERFIQAHELPRFFDALAKLDQVWQDFFGVCLYTGARSGNVKSMRWAEVDFDGKLWTIPATKFKTNRAMQIPLTPAALEILYWRLWEQQPKLGEWVFPTNDSGAECPHIREPRKAWEAIRRDLNAPDIRIHDLRRTLGSWQAATGANLSVIGKTLGHTNTSTTAIYARLNIDPVREALNTATAAIAAAAKAKKP